MEAAPVLAAVTSLWSWSSWLVTSTTTIQVVSSCLKVISKKASTRMLSLKHHCWISTIIQSNLNLILRPPLCPLRPRSVRKAIQAVAVSKGWPGTAQGQVLLLLSTNLRTWRSLRRRTPLPATTVLSLLRKQMRRRSSWTAISSSSSSSQRDQKWRSTSSQMCCRS
jgi:hypothetical protein